MRVANISLVAVFAALILAPVGAQLAGFNPGRPLAENRTLAPPIALPKSWTEAARLPNAVDEYLRDHFGLRRLALQVHDKLVWHVLGDSPSAQVTRGRDGMLFFNSHSAKYPHALTAQSCGIGLAPAAIAPATEAVRTFLTQARRINPSSTLLIIPTKAAVYPELLPAWLGERCRQAVPPMRTIVQQLSGEPQLASMLDYPLDEMLALKTSIKVYPPQSFHWAGDMPRHLAERMSERSFGLARIRSFQPRRVVGPSDLQRFVPGVGLWVDDLDPGYKAAGVQSCGGPSCFPEFGALAARLGDISRFHGGGSGGKLLLVSDSFGSAIAGWYSQYFSDVWHVNVNNLINAPDDRIGQAQLIKAMFAEFAPDHVIYLFHDGAVLYAPGQLSKLLSMSEIATTPGGRP